MNSERATNPIGLELSVTTTERFNTTNQNSEVLEVDDEFKTFSQSKILQRLKLLQIFLGKIKAKHIVSMLLFLVFFFNYLVQDPLNIGSLQITGAYTAKTWDNNTWNIMIDNRLSTFERTLDSDTSLFIFQQYDENIDFAELPNKKAVGCIVSRPLNLISCEMREINDLTRPFILLPVLMSSSNIAFWKTIEQTNLEDSSIVSYRNQDLETILSLELQDSSVKRATFKDPNGSFSIIKHNNNVASGSEREISQVYLEAVKNSLNEDALSSLLPQGIPEKIGWTRFDVPKFVIKCENWNIFSQCSIL